MCFFVVKYKIYHLITYKCTVQWHEVHSYVKQPWVSISKTLTPGKIQILDFYTVAPHSTLPQPQQLPRHLLFL